jgi:hypothetical protein
MKPILKFSILLIVLFACSRKKVDYVGPAYVSAPSGFNVTSFTGTPSSVDFTVDSVLFKAVFPNPVTWTLTITGQTSGAVRTLRGISNSINLIWKGTNDGVTFFRTGETANAVLSFFGTTYTVSTTVNISMARDYTTYGQFPLVGDFENIKLVLPKPPSTYSPYWASFNFPTPIANEVQGIDSMAVDYNGNIVPSVQGKKYYFIRGLGAQPQFVSGLQYFGPLNPKLPSDPSNVWVNMYIYGTGNANAQVDLEYQEDDLGTTIYNPKKDDAWVAHIVLNHIGWKLFSYRYTDLVQSTNVGFGDNGNHIREPQKLISFDLVLLKVSNPNAPVEVYFDFPIITVGGPFDPSK